VRVADLPKRWRKRAKQEEWWAAEPQHKNSNDGHNAAARTLRGCASGLERALDQDLLASRAVQPSAAPVAAPGEGS